MNPTTNIFVVTAPSGTGKSTINRRLVTEIEKLSFSISLTTRKQRASEKNGKHYWFVDQETFEEKIKNHSLIEYANVFGNLSGTSFDEVERLTREGFHVLLEIDVQGFLQVKQKTPSTKSIFIMPPDMQTLWTRLEKRGTDNLETRKRRFQAAHKELSYGSEFDHFVINNDLETAYKEIKLFIREEQPFTLSREQGLAHCSQLQKEFINSGYDEKSQIK